MTGTPTVKVFAQKSITQKMDDLAFKAEDAIHAMKKLARQNGIDTRPHSERLGTVLAGMHGLSEALAGEAQKIEAQEATDDTPDFPTNRPNDNIKAESCDKSKKAKDSKNCPMKKSKAMKMSKDQYELLNIELEEIVATFGKDEVQKYRDNVKYAKDQFTSFVWGMYHKVSPNARKEISKGLVDAHLETALKMALKEYK